MLQLNLGSGTNRRQDYVSVDLYTPEADVQLDLTKRLPYGDEEVDNIYACHVVEHFSREEWAGICKDWSRVIKRGGAIEVRCPDILKVCEEFLNNPTEAFRMYQLYGLQNTEGEYHKNGFTEASLTQSFPDLTPKLLDPSTETELHMKFIKEN